MSAPALEIPWLRAEHVLPTAQNLTVWDVLFIKNDAGLAGGPWRTAVRGCKDRDLDRSRLDRRTKNLLGFLLETALNRWLGR